MFFTRAFKIAAELIEQRLQQEQQREPVDQPDIRPDGQQSPPAKGQSALRLLTRDRPTATEPAAKVLSTAGGRRQ